MKKFLVYKNSQIACISLAEGVPDGELVTEISDAASSLEVRYAVENDQFVDKFAGKPDEQVLAEIAAAVATEATLVFKEVSPVEFKLLFTPQERIALRVARETDPVLQDFFDIAEDPRLTKVELTLESTVMALDYMVSKGLLSSERASKIKLGQRP
jgi:hypothetical protein